MAFLEGSLTLIAVAASFAWPKLGASRFVGIERNLGRLARNRSLTVALVGLSVILLRLTFLPVLPIPLPFVPGDFSFLLAADTFAHGRLTNPTPAMWVHLETIHVDMLPTYQSMYFPGQGLVLAAGQVLFGHPWFGVLIASALMCAGICWMLQGWLPPSWALLGGMICVLRLGVFSYWVNTYHAGGSIAALGGALAMGALPRFMRKSYTRYAVAIAVGAILCAYTRPYEGALLFLPIAIVLGHWTVKARKSVTISGLAKIASAPFLILLCAAIWLGYYDYRAFGNPITLPYAVNRATYAMAPYYVWQAPRPDPSYHHASLRRFYLDEVGGVRQVETPKGFVHQTFNKALRTILFFAGFALAPPIFMLRRVCLDRRFRLLTIALLVLVPGMAIEIFMLPHYLAPFTAVFYAIGAQAMRHLRQFKLGNQSVGRTMTRLMVVVCVIMGTLRLLNKPLNMPVAQAPATNWSGFWFGPDHYGTERATVERELKGVPDGQLVLVRYSPTHDPMDEWVYNSAEIDHSKVIWAREMDSAHNRELINYYRDRNVWLVQPDLSPPDVVAPYPIADLKTPSSQ